MSNAQVSAAASCGTELNSTLGHVYHRQPWTLSLPAKLHP